MSKVKAMIVGVSDYSQLKQNALPFCKDDLAAVNNALINDLSILESDIYICGESGTVIYTDFLKVLANVLKRYPILIHLFLFFWSWWKSWVSKLLSVE